MPETEDKKPHLAEHITERIIDQYGKDTRLGEIAALRRMDPLDPAASLDAAAVLYRGDLLAGVASDSDGYTPVELAVSISTWLWANNYRNRNAMSSKRFGETVRAAASLRTKDGSPDAGFVRRMKALTSASTLEELIQHLGSIVSNVERNSVGVNYPSLAVDLSYLITPQGKIKVGSRTLSMWNRRFFLHEPNQNN